MTIVTNEIESLRELIKRLGEAASYEEKITILDELEAVKNIFDRPGPIRTFISGLSPECEYALKAVAAIGQAPLVFRISPDIKEPFAPLRLLLQDLLSIERFYAPLGGIIGYHRLFLKLLSGSCDEMQGASFEMPPQIDITQDSKSRREYVLEGIAKLGSIAEIYPIGGAGDRLKLIDPATLEPLPAAKLPFLGKTLLEGLIRDLIAREYLHYKLFGEEVVTPVVMMASNEKENHAHIVKILDENQWFLRPKESFFIFDQPSVPVISKEGKWCLLQPLELLKKPSGHGALWKLMKERGAFEWLLKHGVNKLLVRQINNPIAGVDCSLLAFLGSGIKEKKEFGFSSCARRVNAPEGMNVLADYQEKETKKAIVCLEYTDFEKLGIKDEPNAPNSPYSRFPCNTNILFADLKAVERIVEDKPFPGLIINLKSEFTTFDEEGKKIQVRGGRLESMMQNISECLKTESSKPLLSYLTYGEREKTIGVTKCAYEPGKSPLDTPESCFWQYLGNAASLLESCSVKTPSPLPLEEFIHKGAPFSFTYHPALGPLYSVIQQKIKGGCIFDNAEVDLEVAELYWENTTVDGSLRILAESVCRPEGKFSERVGRCYLKNVQIENQGGSLSSHAIWKKENIRKESCVIRLEGFSEFYAEGIVISQNQEIVVPHGYRVVWTKEGIKKEPIHVPSWYWDYTITSDHEIKLVQTWKR